VSIKFKQSQGRSALIWKPNTILQLFTPNQLE